MERRSLVDIFILISSHRQVDEEMERPPHCLSEGSAGFPAGVGAQCFETLMEGCLAHRERDSAQAGEAQAMMGRGGHERGGRNGLSDRDRAGCADAEKLEFQLKGPHVSPELGLWGTCPSFNESGLS